MKMNVATKVRALVEDAIKAQGFVLWDVTFGKEGGEMLLTVTVDKDDDISMEMLSALNAVINDILDEADPIEGAYSLMLESAGAERVLRTDEHIAFAIEKKAAVTMKLYKAIEKVKEFEGNILSYDGTEIEFKTEKETFKIEKKAVSKLLAYV